LVDSELLAARLTGESGALLLFNRAVAAAIVAYTTKRLNAIAR
jgi:hypothetical protein